MRNFSVVSLLILIILLFICYAEASPVTTPARSQTKRLVSCPRNIRMICPTHNKHFVVHSSWSWRSFGCKIEGSIAEIALKECNNSVMDACKEKWEKKPNDCSVPIPVVKQVVDYLFQGACFLHDLCYLSWNTDREDCDDWFLHNMKKICSVRKVTRPLCLAGAHAVYSAVRGFGASNFETAKNWTDNNNCTSKSLATTCPRNIWMICPTDKKHFVVNSSWDGVGCKFDEPITVTALRECNNSVMDVCKDRWENKPNNCSAPVIKEVVDYAFQGACFLHDLCYLSRNTEQKDCDVWFLHNMKQMCLIRRTWFTRLLCRGGAHVVYSAVKSFGRIRFDEAKNWTEENCTSEINPTKGPTSEGSGSGIGLVSGSGTLVQPDEQSTERREVEEQSDENSPKPKQTEPKQSPKQNEQFDEPLH